VGAVVAGVLSAAGPAQADTVQPPSWVDCGGGFQCATVEVPTDYAQPSAGTSPIALIRLPASDPAQRTGSLFVNPGGPGGSGVDFVRQAARFIYSPAARARFDVVGFDPRGVGGSDELRCFTDAQEQAAFWGDLPPWPLTPNQERPYIRRTAQYTELCGRRNGARLDHLSTVDVARDLDLLRAAVGDEKLTYVGYSYGSYLGEVYANLFPGRVRALALDGVLDPESWANESPRMLSDAAFGGEQTLDAFAASCAAAGSACPFAAGDTGARVRERLDAIMIGLTRAPLPAPNADPPGELDYYLGNSAYLISMYDTFFWPIFAAGLAQAETGDGSILLDFIRLFFAPPGVYDNSGDMWSAVSCTDGTMPRNGDLWPNLVRLSELRAPTFSRYWWYGSLPCATWPGHAPERYAGPWDRPTAAPILMLNTVADPATAYAGAVRAQRRMADARLVTVDGWGHTSLADPSTCARQVLDRYLLDGVAPANGLHCAPDAGPFPAGLVAASSADSTSNSTTASVDATAVRPPLPWLPVPR
jgi:pimeloyl-ACP methyl ester carboxylesterase